MNDGGNETGFGRLLHAGVMYVHDNDISLGIAKNSVRADFAYLGKGTWAVGTTSTSGAVSDIFVLVNSWIVNMGGAAGGDGRSKRLFPCDDSLGVMSPDLTQVGGTGTTNKLAMMGAFYGAESVELSHLTSVVGAAVSKTVVPGTMGASVEIIQIPDINGCLPPEMIGDWSFYNTRTIAWAEH